MDKFVKEILKNKKIYQELIKPHIIFDKEYDILYISFKGDLKVKSCLEVGDDYVFDLDNKANIIGIEIMDFMDKLNKPPKKPKKEKKQ